MAGATLERLDDLLLGRATEGLDATETLELERLLAANAGASVRGYEEAAAAVCLAVCGRGLLPGAVRARLERNAAELAAGAGTSDG